MTEYKMRKKKAVFLLVPISGLLAGGTLALLNGSRHISAKMVPCHAIAALML